MSGVIIYKQFQDLKEKFSGFQLRYSDVEYFWLEGVLHFIGDLHDEFIEDKYEVKIIIPRGYPMTHPSVQEIGKRIPADFHHYLNGSLCLGTHYAIRKTFLECPTLLWFTEKCLIPYLYIFSYKEKFGYLPFGELAHGWPGIIEYYQSLFHVSDGIAVLELLKVLANGNFYKHARCPCGSGKRIRNCHGSMLEDMLRVQSGSNFKTEYDYIIDSISHNPRFVRPRRPV